MSQLWDYPSLSNLNLKDVKNDASPYPEAPQSNQRINERNVEIQKMLDDKYRQGYDEGKKESENKLGSEYNHEINNLHERVESILGKMHSQYLISQQNIERDSIKLIIAIASRVIKKEVILDDQVVIRQIHEAMRRVSGIERLKLRVNPADESLVKSKRAELVTSADAVHDLVIEADESIDAGGCILESDAGNVDARLSTQLQQIEAALISESSEEALLQ